MAILYALLAAILASVGCLLLLPRIVLRTESPKTKGSTLRKASGVADSHRVSLLVGWVNKVLPQARQSGDGARRRIARAGLSITPTTYHGLSIIFYVITFAAMLMLVPWLHLDPSPKAALCIAVGILTIAAPRLYLYRKAYKRAKKIRATLHQALELLAIGLDAGQTIPRSIRLVAQKGKGPLAKEFAIVDSEVTFMGYTLTDALQRMADRCQVAELSQFVASVIASTKAGSGMADVLKSQANHVFDRYSQDIETQCNKLDVKMLFPIMFISFPAFLLAAAIPFMIYLMSQASIIGL